MTKVCESALRDSSKLSRENAAVIADYIIALKREVNSRLNYIKYTIQFLSELSNIVGIRKNFIDMTSDDALCYLDRCRKSESEDSIHKWIGRQILNLKRRRNEGGSLDFIGRSICNFKYGILTILSHITHTQKFRSCFQFREF